MNTRTDYANRNILRPSGLHAECRWHDYLMVAVMVAMVSFVLVGACDGMLADTVRPVATVQR
jgi:hypothetical protein